MTLSSIRRLLGLSTQPNSDSSYLRAPYPWEPDNRLWLKLTLCGLGIVLVAFHTQILLSLSAPAWIEHDTGAFPFNAAIGALGTLAIKAFVEEFKDRRERRSQLAWGLTHPDLLMKHLTPKTQRAVAEAALSKVLSNDSFASDLLAFLDTKVVRYSPYRRDYRHEIALKRFRQADLVAHQFYRGFESVSYRTVIGTRRRVIKLYTNREAYDSEQNNPELEFRWLSEPRAELCGNDAQYFNVVAFRIRDFNGRAESIASRIVTDKDGSKTMSFDIPRRFRVGKEVEISYELSTLYLKRSHGAQIYIRVPCEGLFCEIDFSEVDIGYMNCHSFIASSAQVPVTAKTATRISLELQDGWVLPRSGICFVWNRTGERQLDFASAKQTVPEQAALIDGIAGYEV